MLRVTSLSVLPEEGDHDLVCLSALTDGCAPLTRTCMLKVVDAQGMGRRRLRAAKMRKCAVRRPKAVDRIHRSDPVHYNYLTDTIRSDTVLSVHSAVLDRICLIGSMI